MQLRKGNLNITMFIAVAATMMITAMLSLATTQRLNTKGAAEKAGDLASYIAIANLCADAFRDDLESQYSDLPIATVDDVDGLIVTFEDYAQIVENIQQPLKRELASGEDISPAWLYLLSDPTAPLDYTGLETPNNEDFSNYYRDLIRGAKLEIRVDAPVSISGATVDDTGITYQSGDRLYLNDITYTVTLERGMTHVIQHYRLTGEYVRYTYMTAYVHGEVSGERAQNILESQSVSQTAIRSVFSNKVEAKT